MHAPRPPRPLRLLLVEQSADAADSISRTLRDQFGAQCVHHCGGIAEALGHDLDDIDLVLTDMNLPDGTGLELLGQLLERRRDLPVVLVTRERALENAVTAIRSGAYDYIVKSHDDQFAIPLVVEKNLALHRVKRENQRLHGELEQSLEQVQVKNHQLQAMVHKLETMATTDPLTGLANRRALTAAFDRCFAEAQRSGRDLACLMIDLDWFKQLNDTLGHRQGDQMLQQAARVLEANCRRSDIAGRFGGDEFILILPDTIESTAATVGQRIANEFARMADLELAGDGYAGRVTMSLGLATLHLSRAVRPEQLIDHADHALYCAKQTGKMRLVVHRPACDPTAGAKPAGASRSYA